MNNKKRTPSDSYHITDTIKLLEDCITLERTSYKGTEILSKQVYTLTKINEVDLARERMGKNAGLVFKHNDDLFYSPIPRKMKFLSTFNIGKHLCSNCGRLSALPDCEGGCRKVRERPLTPLELNSSSNPVASFKHSKRIEKYDFIVMGLETFNTSQDSLVVFQCKNRTDIKKRPKVSAILARKWKADLAASWYDEAFEKFN